MPNFFLIDHSLDNEGGHHAAYTRLVAAAAVEMGFETTIGTSIKLKPGALSETGLTVRRAFRQSTYQTTSLLAGLQSMKRRKEADGGTEKSRQKPASRMKRIRDSFRNANRESKRHSFIRKFAQDCNRFFQPSTFSDSDHVFFTTVSELELMGLAAWMATEPRTIQAHWHLQFHFSLFDGRTPEYSMQQSRLRDVQTCFDAALGRVPSHALHFYTTSETLADQYNCLRTARFENLTYPVSPEFRIQFSKMADPNAHKLSEPARIISSGASLNQAGTEQAGTEQAGTEQAGTEQAGTEQAGTEQAEGSSSVEKLVDNRRESGDQWGDEFSGNEIADASDLEGVLSFDEPLKITVPGAIRREKGQLRALQEVVDQIGCSHLQSGTVQLVVQRPDRKLRLKEKIELSCPASATGRETEPVVYKTHPLPENEYTQLIRDSDCGLLLYDNRTYFSRRAGVMSELLSCGKPVIVPAGTWLADQVQEPSAAYVAGLIASAERKRELDLSALSVDGRNVPASGGIVSFDTSRCPFEFEFQTDSDENGVAIRFDWHWPDMHGSYAQIEVFEMAGASEVGTSRRVIGRSRRTGDSLAYFRLKSETARVRVRMSNAFHHSNISVKNLSVQTIGSDDAMPVGSVGIVAVDDFDVGACIDELVEHYDHYSSSARRFAGAWQNMHDPRRTIAGLTGRERFQSQVA